MNTDCYVTAHGRPSVDKYPSASRLSFPDLNSVQKFSAKILVVFLDVTTSSNFNRLWKAPFIYSHVL